jgi:hypothetical protein
MPRYDYLFVKDKLVVLVKVLFHGIGSKPRIAGGHWAFAGALFQG